jgi:hypothetical protein
MSKIIISYRRADSAAISGRIFDRLASHYGDDAVFMDVDKIPFGTDFREHIRKVLLEGDILLAVIGPNWLGKGADGTSRIKDEADPVRVEVETALRQKTRVIPVLVDGAAMPSTADLPDALRDLAYLNAAPLDVGRDFRAHMDRLIRSIDEVLGPGHSRPAAARTGKRRSALRVALITSAAAMLIVLAGTAGFMLMLPGEPARQSAAERGERACRPAGGYQPAGASPCRAGHSQHHGPLAPSLRHPAGRAATRRARARSLSCAAKRLRRRAESAQRPGCALFAGGRDPGRRDRHRARCLPRLGRRLAALVRRQVAHLFGFHLKLLYRGREDRRGAPRRLSARKALGVA